LTTDVFQRVPGTTFSNFFERNREAIPEKVAVVTLDELRRHVLRFFVEVYHRRVHRGLGVSPMEAWAESVRRNGMRPMPDPERVTTALSQVAYRIPQRYGIEFEGLVYNSVDVAAYRVRRGAPKAVRIAVDPRDLARIRFLDPADNRFVEVPIQEAMRERVRGVTLEKHKLARALQRANPERLAGEKGLARAYALIDDAMRERGAANGMANRRDAARYWEALTKARPPEEPPAFDTVASARGVTNGLFGDGFELEAEAPTLVPAVPDAEPDGAPRPKRDRKAKEKRPDGDGAPPPGEPAAPAAEDGEDLVSFARTLGMSVRKNSDRGQE
jgi:putative transposase